jgi:hypothetical protein
MFARRREETEVWMRIAARLASRDRGPASQNFQDAEAALRAGVRPRREYDEITGAIKSVTYPGLEWRQPKPRSQRDLDTATKYFMIYVCFESLEEKYPNERQRNIFRVTQHMERLGVPDVGERTVETALAAERAIERVRFDD